MKNELGEIIKESPGLRPKMFFFNKDKDKE